jgi:hypothetical protein
VNLPCSISDNNNNNDDDDDDDDDLEVYSTKGQVKMNNHCL